MKRLETSRLILRDFKLSDLDDYYEMLSNPNVAIPNGSIPLKSFEEARKQIEDMIGTNRNYAIVHKVNRKVIGCIGVNEDALGQENTRNLGVILNEDYWNEGYMTEALDIVIKNAHEYTEQLSIIHSPDNDKSKRMAEKLNFKFLKMIEKSECDNQKVVYEPYYTLKLERDHQY